MTDCKEYNLIFSPEGTEGGEISPDFTKFSVSDQYHLTGSRSESASENVDLDPGSKNKS